MNAALSERALTYAEDVEQLHAKLELLSTATDDNHIVQALDQAMHYLRIAGISINFAARRAGSLAIEEQRQQEILIERLRASLAQARCERVAAQ